jgi:hypothetical protein
MPREERSLSLPVAHHVSFDRLSPRYLRDQAGPELDDSSLAR